jgi:Family of unknown function (DUF6247)
MSAQPVDDFDQDDPVEILRVLPARYHEQFLAEYDAAAVSARRPEEYQQLHRLLRLWRLRAAAYSEPGFEARLEAASTGSGEWTPIEQVIPDWADRPDSSKSFQSCG